MTDLETVGDRIAFARSQKGLSQQELAERLGMGNATQISQWETNVRTPRPRRLAEIARALDTTTDWLTSGIGARPGKAASHSTPRHSASGGGTNGHGSTVAPPSGSLAKIRELAWKVSLAEVHEPREVPRLMEELRTAYQQWRPTFTEEQVDRYVNAIMVNTRSIDAALGVRPPLKRTGTLEDF